MQNTMLTQIKSYLSDETIILPFWVKKALTQNKLDYIDVLDYKKIRRIMSVEDLIEFYSSLSIFGDSLEVDSVSNQSVLNSVYECGDRDLINEFKVSVLPKLHSKDIVAQIRDRLLAEQVPGEMVDFKSTYSIQLDSSRKVFIFLDKGFINTMSDIMGKRMFLTEYLSALYSFKKVAEVSSYGVFKEYIKTLS